MNNLKLYFSYGSNLWQEQMDTRCPGHHYFGRGILKGYRWSISARGYANIIRSDGEEVYGIVYRINEDDEASLDKAEGVHKSSYRKETLLVEVERTRYQCLVYVDPVVAEGEPKEEYIVRINKAVADAGLPLEYVDRYIRKFVPLHP
jgi:gamma-glutamylcyclotransferase (GGCT)/AIG2-like uncharacterized protein YtfP